MSAIIEAWQLLPMKDVAAVALAVGVLGLLIYVWIIEGF